MTTIPKVVEYYRDFEDSVGMREICETALASVPAHLLAGLGTVVLRDVATLTRDERKSSFQSSRRRRVKNLSRAKGLYYYGGPGLPPHIEIFPDNILKELHPAIPKIPILREFWLSKTLFHEVGHHIHATNHPRKGEKEHVAKEWQRELARAYLLQRFKFLRPLVALVHAAKAMGRFARRVGKGGS